VKLLKRVLFEVRVAVRIPIFMDSFVELLGWREMRRCVDMGGYPTHCIFLEDLSAINHLLGVLVVTSANVKHVQLLNFDLWELTYC
jgi:hypothetical protein